MAMRSRWTAAVVMGLGISTMVATAGAENGPATPSDHPSPSNVPAVHISAVVASLGPAPFVVTPGGFNYGVQIENPATTSVSRAMRFHSYGQSEIPDGPFSIPHTGPQGNFMRVVLDPHGIDSLCSPYPQKVEFILLDGATTTQTVTAQVQAKDCVFDVKVRDWFGPTSDVTHAARRAAMKGKIATTMGSVTQAASCAQDGKLHFDVWSDRSTARTVMVELVRGVGEIVASRQITINPNQTIGVELDLLRSKFATNGPQSYRVRIDGNNWDTVEVTRTCKMVTSI